jgi:HAD superfamily hydrolase (TIGR01509 family)
LLLLDLDGVLRRFTATLPAVLEAAFEPSLLHRAVTGVITDEQWRASVPGGASWNDSGEVISEALELVRAARQRCFVALLTNATTRLEADLSLLGLEREVDAVVSSARTGVAKPDPRAFLGALERLGYSTAVYCDDSSKNVEAALALGIDAVHVPDTQALRVALATRDLIPATVLVVLPDRDDAESVARELLSAGWSPCAVHRDMLAGEDDAEDVDWVVEVTTAPDGLPASAHRAELDELAERFEGFTGDH